MRLCSDTPSGSCRKKANDILPITSLQLRLKTLISSRFQASSFD